MGAEQTITAKEVIGICQPEIERMSKLAANAIKELNGGKSPSAVFIVGGGGKIKGFDELVAAELGLDPKRVALRGEEIHYFKTQYVNYLDTIIDTPGEYTELRQTSGALALYAYEADVVGLVLSANEPYSIFSPCITNLVNREVVGIVSGIDKPDANVERVSRWLRLAGCKKIFPVSAVTGEGLSDIIAYLEQD